MATWADLGVQFEELERGDNYRTCPRCSPGREKSWVTCLSINREKGVFNCHHCGWSGRVDGFEALHTDTTDWSQHHYNEAPPRDLRDLPQEAVEWFAGRGITLEVLALNKIQWGQAFRKKSGEHVDGIFFPYLRDGVVVNRKRRPLTEKLFLMEKGCELIPYGLDDLSKLDETVIVVEGEIDKLSWNVADVWNVISVPNGAPKPDAKNLETHLRWFDSPQMEKLHGRVTRWIIDVDNDGPGRNLENLLARRWGYDKVFVTRKPAGCKDANDVLVEYGVEGLKKMLAEARPCPVQGIWEANDPAIAEALELDYLDENPTPGFSLGFASLDPLIRVMPGNFVVLTGIPGMGKGEFLDQACVNLANEYGWKTAFFSPENSPIHKHIRKLVEKKVGLSTRNTYGPHYRMSLEQLREARDWVDEHFTFILPAEGDWRLESLLKLFENVVRRKGVRNIVLDPWNEISHVRAANGDGSETDAINAELSRIKRFGQSQDVVTWVVAHPTKMRSFTANDGSEQFPVPKLYDISGSAHFANRADFGLAVHRDISKSDKQGYQNFLEVYVHKARWKEQGQPGSTRLQWDRISGCLTSDLSRIASHVSVPQVFQETVYEDEEILLG